jgi:hypothetical protein
MNFKNPAASLPPMAYRVLVETGDGSVLFGKRVVSPDNPQQYRWIDDQSCPIRSPVVGWAEVVSQGETP